MGKEKKSVLPEEAHRSATMADMTEAAFAQRRRLQLRSDRGRTGREAGRHTIVRASLVRFAGVVERQSSTDDVEQPENDGQAVSGQGSMTWKVTVKAQKSKGNRCDRGEVSGPSTGRDGE